MTGYEYLSLDPRFDGSCPCATFEVDGTRFDAHCWRVCSVCEYAGLHWEGSREVAERVFAALASMEWGDWQIVGMVRR